MRFNEHHIIYAEPEQDPTPYDDDECQACGHIRRQDWTVDIPAFLHQHLNVVTSWNKKPTYERYALLTSYIHAISYLWNDMRRELDRMDEESK